MTEFQATDPSDKQGNKLPAVGEYVKTLLADEQIKRLPEAEQGTIIADRFIGALVRHGEIEGSVDSYTPEFTLQLIADYANGKQEDLKVLTSKEGIRSAAFQLSEDVRTAGLLHLMANELIAKKNPSTGELEYTLTSPAQVEGYIQAGGAKNRLQIHETVPGVNMQGEEWAPVLLEQVQRMATDPHLNWTTMNQAYGLMESSSPYIRNTGRDWQSAIYTAQKVGIDTDLLKRSAEKIQQRLIDKEDLGARAMFLATGGRIKNYQDRLRSRSGM